MVDHLSKLTIAHDSHSPPIKDEFPEESLLLVENALWYVHIANYLVIGEVPVEWKAQDNKYFFAKIHSYYWEDPFLFKYCADQIIRSVCLKKNNRGFSITAMKMLVEVILLHKRQL